MSLIALWAKGERFLAIRGVRHLGMSAGGAIFGAFFSSRCGFLKGQVRWYKSESTSISLVLGFLPIGESSSNWR
jgi:hypothetical protein